MNEEKCATAWAVCSNEGRSFVTTDPLIAEASIRHSSVVPNFDELPAAQRYGHPIPRDMEARLLARARSEHLQSIRANS